MMMLGILMPNIKDVAKSAGVAPITVSRVINNSGYVSDDVRNRVEKAIKLLNYIPNKLGPSMRSKRSNTIGLIVTDITNPFWTTVVRGVEDATYKAGYHLFLCNSDEDANKEHEYIELLLSRQVDGFLVAPAETQFKPLELIQKQGKSLVLLDRHIAAEGIDIVRGDSKGASYILTKHLLDLNHKHIVLLNGPESVSTARDRADGFCEALREAGFKDDEINVYWGEFSQESGYRHGLEILQLRPRPTAIVAANNFIAIGAIRALDRSGLPIPEDMSLVVFDDLPEHISLRPFLTAATQPAYEMGFLAANTLFAHLNGEAVIEPKQVVLPFELKVRSSSAPPTNNL
jgi:LacI family transcriptional regulator